MSQIDLVWINASAQPPPYWPLGNVFEVADLDVQGVGDVIEEHLSPTRQDAFLLWDAQLGTPNSEHVSSILAMPGDLWHAGLRLGTGGLPSVMDFVQPTWMLNRDPDENHVATSWRVSLRACLVRAETLRQLGGPRKGFHSLDAAALEMGHRYLSCGALTRHVPMLVQDALTRPDPQLTAEDEFRFVYYRFGRKWMLWAFVRALLTAYRRPLELIEAWGRVKQETLPQDPKPLQHALPAFKPDKDSEDVTIVIPTLQRYGYLHTLLAQLRDQTVPPAEIIVIDQTPAEEREVKLADAYDDLPLTVLTLKAPGQCTARNAALNRARGDLILFLDDDDEIESDLIEKHIRSLQQFSADVSCGVAEEAGAGPLPEWFTRTRCSDVFPTNNTLMRKNILRESGLFDLAYDNGRNEDGDLGIRVYLSGALMVLNPHITLFHHHAPAGGLRVRKARVVTYASSRKRILQRNLPSTSEMYLAMRYFSDRQVREMKWIRVLSTFGFRGSTGARLLKALVSTLALPHTTWVVRQRARAAAAMFFRFPIIPQLTEEHLAPHGKVVS